ncbi:MAG: hypothetical protein V3R68_08720, partial [Gammaproteobacteria bacterium]
LGLMRFARTCSLHQSYGYDCSHEHAQKTPAPRAPKEVPLGYDHLANSCNMRAKDAHYLFLSNSNSNSVILIFIFYNQDDMNEYKTNL